MLRPASLACALALAPSALAGVSFDFDFLDSPGVGFRAPGAEGEGRRAALNEAGAYLSGVLWEGYNATIDVAVFGGETDDDLLASAGPEFNEGATGLSGFASSGDVRRQILGGDASDPAPRLPDAQVVWNFQDFEWETGTDFQPGEQDFLSTAIHELTHTLGFGSSISASGESGYGDAPGEPALWEAFDRYLADAGGVALIDESGVLDVARWDEASVGDLDAALTFIGPSAVAANGGEFVFLHNPEPWEEGSSASHLAALYGSLMAAESQNEDGLELRELSSIELGILEDLGYRLASSLTADPTPPGAPDGPGSVVPTPTAAAAGLFLLAGLGARRRGENTA